MSIRGKRIEAIPFKRGYTPHPSHGHYTEEEMVAQRAEYAKRRGWKSFTLRGGQYVLRNGKFVVGVDYDNSIWQSNSESASAAWRKWSGVHKAHYVRMGVDGRARIHSAKRPQVHLRPNQHNASILPSG